MASELTGKLNDLKLLNEIFLHQFSLKWNFDSPAIWRKYMRQITTLFGGDRVIYLADNAHPLDKYISYDDSFKEIENELLAEFGKPSSTFKEVTEDYQRRYFIDRFDDLK